MLCPYMDTHGMDPSGWTLQIREALRAAGHEIDEDIVEELSNHADSAFQSARARGFDKAEATQHVQTLITEWCASADLLRHRPRREPLIEAPASGRFSIAALLHEITYGVR